MEREKSSPDPKDLYSVSVSLAFRPHNPWIGPLGMVVIALTSAPLGSNLTFWYRRILTSEGNSISCQKRFDTWGRAQPANPLPGASSTRILRQTWSRATCRWKSRGHFPSPRYRRGGGQQKQRCLLCWLWAYPEGSTQPRVSASVLPGSGAEGTCFMQLYTMMKKKSNKFENIWSRGEKHCKDCE